MLGHFKPNLCTLSVPSHKIYRLTYCSLCHILRKRFGLWAAWLINHELTLALIAINFQTIAKFEVAYTRCPASLWLIRKRIYVFNSSIIEAANLVMLLAWFKAIDLETDYSSIGASWLRQILERKINKHQYNFDDNQIIKDYAAITRRHDASLMEVSMYSSKFAQYMIRRLIATVGCSVTEEHVDIFAMAGRITPLADHLLDLSIDIKNGHFNPIVINAKHNNLPLSIASQNFLYQYQEASHALKVALIKLEATTPFFVEIALNGINQLSASINKVYNLETENLDTKSDSPQNKKICNSCDSCDLSSCCDVISDDICNNCHCCNENCCACDCGSCDCNC